MLENSPFQGIIRISFPWDLPERVEGPAVIFDVNAASRNIASLAQRAESLYVADTRTVFRALKSIPEAIFLGESEDPRIAKRLLKNNNSASWISEAPAEGKKVILITNNGTQAIHEVWNKGGRPVAIGSYPNLDTVIRWLLIEYRETPVITLVPAGGREKIYKHNRNLLEDLLCARAAAKLLRGESVDREDDYRRAREYMEKHYPSPPKEEDLQLIFPPKDTIPVVPVCEEVEKGLIKIRIANDEK